jgi:hypothetical protein
MTHAEVEGNREHSGPWLSQIGPWPLSLCLFSPALCPTPRYSSDEPCPKLGELAQSRPIRTSRPAGVCTRRPPLLDNMLIFLAISPAQTRLGFRTWPN